jgi:hypothetical protein
MTSMAALWVCRGGQRGSAWGRAGGDSIIDDGSDC